MRVVIGVIAALAKSATAGRAGGVILGGMLFVFVISPVLNFNGVEVQLPKVVMSVLAALGILRLASRGAIDRRLLSVLLALAMGFVYLAFVFSIYQFRDALMLKTTIWAFAIFFGSFWIVCVYRDHYGERFVSRLMWHVFLVGTLHGAIMITAFLFSDFREWLYQYIWLNEEGRKFVEFNFRSPGLTSSGGAKLSVFQALAMMCGLVQSADVVRSARRLILLLMACLILIGSIVLSGRTGLIVLALGIMFLTLRRIFRLVSGASVLLRNVLTIGAIGTLVVAGIVSLELNQYQRVLFRALEFYYSWQETGRLGTASTDVIFSRMYFWPEDMLSLMLGTSNFGRGEELPYIESDVGYVRFVFGAGIVGTIIAFSHFAVIGWHVLVDRMSPRNLKAMIGFMLSILVLVNFKELLFVDIHGWTQLVFLLFCAFVVHRQEQQRCHYQAVHI
jgi:hypothetical protein